MNLLMHVFSQLQSIFQLLLQLRFESFFLNSETQILLVFCLKLVLLRAIVFNLQKISSTR